MVYFGLHLTGLVIVVCAFWAAIHFAGLDDGTNESATIEFLIGMAACLVLWFTVARHEPPNR